MTVPHRASWVTPCLIAVCVALLAPMAPAETIGITDEEAQELKALVIELINTDRARHGATLVEHDEVAETMGDQYCEMALRSGVRGHYLTDGLSPFHRYAFWAGGADYTGQNVCSTYGTNRARWDFASLRQRLIEYHGMMMAERPPADWHRKNILNPWHTHVGIGLACGPTGVRMTQEFVNRHVELEPLETEQRTDASPRLRGKILNPKSFELAGITVFYEPPPREMTVAEANRHNSYGLPDEHQFLRLRLPPGSFYTDTRDRGHIEVDEDGSFECRLRFWRDTPGIYGIMVRLKPRGAEGAESQFPATYACVRTH